RHLANREAGRVKAEREGAGAIKPLAELHLMPKAVHESALPCFGRPVAVLGLRAGYIAQHCPHLRVLVQIARRLADPHHGILWSAVNDLLCKGTLRRAAKDDCLRHCYLPCPPSSAMNTAFCA